MKVLLTGAILVLLLCIDVSCVKEKVVYPTAASADFSIPDQEFEIGKEIQLTDASVPDDGNKIVNWNWDFGSEDVASLNEQNPQVVYKEEGIYKITLTVTDNNGLKASVTKNINVIDPANNVRIVWTEPLAESIENTVSPAMSPDEKTVYMIADRADANGDLELFAYQADNGNLQWKFNIDNALSNLNPSGNPRIVYCSPSVGVDGTIYIAVRDLQSPSSNRKTFLFAINPNGAFKWTYAFGYDANINYITPAIDANGDVYVGGLTNTPFQVVSLNPADGSVIKTMPLTVGVRAGLAISKNGDVYFASTGSNGAFSYNSITGSQVFNYQPTGLSSMGGAFSIGEDGTVYTTSTIGANGGIFAINPDGSEKWKYQTSGAIDFGGVVIGPDGSLYASGGRTSGTTGKSDGLVALKSDGTLKWKFETDEPVTNCVPLVDNRGYIHFVTDKGTYYVIKGDGTLFGTVSLGAKSFSSPVMDKNGLVYIGAERIEGTSEMLCISTRATGPSDSPWPMKGQNSRRTNLQK
jgi:PKD repeat protein